MSILNLIKPDFVFRQVSDLHPEFCKEQGLKALIFDLDDTLAVEHSGEISQEMLNTVKHLQKAQIKIGIITNNFHSHYCTRIRDLLKDNDLVLPIIENAYKPSEESFTSFLDLWDLQPGEIGMVGDGILTDTLGAKLHGLKSIRVKWFKSRFIKQDFLLFVRELAVTTFDNFRKFILLHKSQFFNFEKNAISQIVFLVNTQSGSYKKLGFELKDELQKINTDHNDKVFHVLPIDDLKAKQKFLRQIKMGFIDKVVAVGGDGTVREAINLISNNWETALGIIPLGTGNLLAKRLNIPLEFTEAMQVALQGQLSKITICSANKKFFAMIAGFGFDASIMKETSSEQKQMIGPLAYLVQGVIKFINLKGHIFIIKLNSITFKRRSVGLIAMIGNNLIEAFLPGTAPENDNDKMDVYVMKENPSRLNLITCSFNLLTSNHEGDPNIEHYQTSELTVQSRPKCDVQIDGDYVGSTPVHIKLHSKILKVLVPPPAEERKSENSK